MEKTGTATAGGLVAGWLPRSSEGKMPLPADAKLITLAPYWGFKGTVDAFCAAAKKEGYEGAEIYWPPDVAEQQAILAATKKYGLELGLLCRSDEIDPVRHLADFKKVIDGVLSNTVQKPLYINCHTGRDFYRMADGLPLLEAAQVLEKKYGVPVWHETHRSRMFYSAPVTRQYLEKKKDFFLNCDLSHWCAVHETMLEDQEETMKLVLSRTSHIHCRIGHPEGPQVNDPRAPEWKAVVDRHFYWWDEIIKAKLQRGEKMITILTEFGPPTYMPTLPYTRQPVADQWEVNVHMMHMLKDRYSHFGGA